ncbi:MAG: hypothetical protein ABR950_02450 [Candidatus Dormibacteria bacterium]|jgi:hypothetical protein
MSIQVAIEDGRGLRLAQIGDIKNVLGELLGRFSGPLAGIDPYGRSMFNRTQIALVVDELERLTQSEDATAEQRAFLSSLLTLARRVGDEPHTYLWFYGD